MAKSKAKQDARKRKQRVAKRYTKAREDAQLAGVIPTLPVEAVRNERVDPATQGAQPLPGPVREALSKGWSTPEHKKPQIVDEMIGIVEDPEMFPGFKIQAARVLQQGDQQQWERDHPEEAGKVRGGGKGDVIVNNQLNFLDGMRAATQVQVKPDPLEEKMKAIDVPAQGKPTE